MFSDLLVFTQTQFYTFLYVIPKNQTYVTETDQLLES